MRVLYQASAAPVLARPEAATTDRWYQRLAEPVRAVAVATALVATAGPVPVAAPGTPATAADRWLQPLSLPLRGAPPLPAAAAGFAVPTDTALLLRPEATSADRWWRQWSEPVRASLPLPRGATPQAAAPVAPVVPPPPEIVTADKWFRPLAEPVLWMRLRLALVGPTTVYGAPITVAPVPQSAAAPAADRVLRSPGRRRLLTAPQRRRKLP